MSRTTKTGEWSKLIGPRPPENIPDWRSAAAPGGIDKSEGIVIALKPGRKGCLEDAPALPIAVPPTTQVATNSDCKGSPTNFAVPK